MYRYQLEQSVILGPTRETATIVAREQRDDGSRKYRVRRSIDGKRVEILADESALDPISIVTR